MVRRRRRLSHAEPLVRPEMIKTVRDLARPLRSPGDLDPLLERIGEARYVLLGEASHGTHEYYTWRTALSQRLIEEKGFSLIAVEGDWPACYGVNRYVRGSSDVGESAHEVLHGFQRWPTWMWANEEVVELCEWLRARNERLSDAEKVGFYGLDVYSLWDSLYHVLGYLAKHQHSTLPAAQRAFQCFEPYGEDVREYARAVGWMDQSCEDEVVRLLTELRHESSMAEGGDDEARFNTDQNALVVKNAEHYYRIMVQGGPESWNIRDRHMVETLERLMQHHGPRAKAIVWEHNTHIGDARFTDMADADMINVGQLVREQHDDQDVVLVGFGSHRGSVVAGDRWEADMEVMPVPPAREGSWEHVLHEACGDDRLLLLDQLRRNDAFLEERGHRAIGVVYHPERDPLGNFVPTVLPRRYDAFVYLDETAALRPLHEMKVRHDGEVPETYPSGM